MAQRLQKASLSPGPLELLNETVSEVVAAGGVPPFSGASGPGQLMLFAKLTSAPPQKISWASVLAPVASSPSPTPATPQALPVTLEVPQHELLWAVLSAEGHESSCRAPNPGPQPRNQPVSSTQSPAGPDRTVQFTGELFRVSSPAAWGAEETIELSKDQVALYVLGYTLPLRPLQRPSAYWLGKLRNLGPGSTPLDASLPLRLMISLLSPELNPLQTWETCSALAPDVERWLEPLVRVGQGLHEMPSLGDRRPERDAKGVEQQLLAGAKTIEPVDRWPGAAATGIAPPPLRTEARLSSDHLRPWAGAPTASAVAEAPPPDAVTPGAEPVHAEMSGAAPQGSEPPDALIFQGVLSPASAQTSDLGTGFSAVSGPLQTALPLASLALDAPQDCMTGLEAVFSPSLEDRQHKVWLCGSSSQL